MLKHLELSHLWGPVLKPMLIGSLPLAALSALFFYVIAFYAAKLFQARRQVRRLSRIQSRMAGSAESL